MSKPKGKRLLSDIHFSIIVRGNLMEDEVLTVFENFNIRRHYDEAKDKWYFSIIYYSNVDSKKIIKKLGNIGINLLNVCVAKAQFNQ
ncbi:MAG: hypothetical protein LBD98_02465 [Endomicrobium sp.]|jgi:hypothetical protein|nr:hypothetical protein [Endomicrobium sp.]